MKKHGYFFKANVVLAVLLGILFLLDLLIFASLHSLMQDKERERYELGGQTEETDPGKNSKDVSECWEEGDDPNDFYQRYDLIKIADWQIEPIGDTYKKIKAEEGSQFYQVTIQVKNQGTREKNAGYLGIYFDGKEYSDVEEIVLQTSEDDSDMDYYIQEVIPAGQTGIYTRVLQIKDGVTSFEMKYYGEEDEPERYTIEVP